MAELVPFPPVTVIQIMLSIWLFSRCLPERESDTARSVACAVCFVAGCAIINLSAHLLEPHLTAGLSVVLLVTTFVLTLAAEVGFVALCRQASLWQAVFCATAAYVMQNLAAGLTDTLRSAFPAMAAAPSWVPALLVTLVVYGACYRVFLRSLEREGLSDVTDRGLLFILAAVIFVSIIFNIANGILEYHGTSLWLCLIFRLVHAVTCVFILFSELRMLHTHQLEVDMAAMEQLMAERERQYEVSRETIDAINVKCHDIRHQIRHLEDSGAVRVDREVLDDIAREVNVYDSAVKTGNDALDTILTEKSLVCEREGISLSCIADGKLLGFMRPAELYALLGNALENAIEATRKVPDPKERVISLTISERAGAALVHVENAFVGEVDFADGLPKTTKGDTASHGFGMRSMQMTVERHGGTLSAGTHGNTFFLNMMIPVPRE